MATALSKEKKNQTIIGRKDIVSFPFFELNHVPVKIDSGAYSSSMHCSLIELLDNHQLKVVFLDQHYNSYTGTEHVFTQFKVKKVKSSNGTIQERYFIFGTVELFGIVYTTIFSLTQRTGLRTPVLLGRKLLNKHFLIDPSKINLSYSFTKPLS
jgi:hypothetical protein